MWGRWRSLASFLSLTPAHRTQILERSRKDSKTLAGFIQTGIDDKSIRPCNPILASSAVFGALNWVPKWYKFDGRYDAAETAATFVDVLTRGMAK